VIRWKYVIPRLIILCLLGLLVWLGSNPALRWMVIFSGQSTIGAKVDVGRVQTSWSDGKMQLTDLEIADPREPMKNLAQTDSAILQINSGRFLHKEFVVEQCKLENVQFNTPRTKSGALKKHTERSPGYVKWLTDPLKQKMGVMGQSWLDQFKANALDKVEDNFETVQVAKKINHDWTQRYQYQKNKAKSTEAKIKNLKTLISQPQRNPLRELERIQNAITQLNELQRDMTLARREIQQLESQFNQDRRELANAKVRDEQKIRKSAEYFKINSSTTTELLLGKEKSRYLSEVMQWVNWFRSAVPDPENDFYPARMRGENIAFEGLKPRPRFLVQQAEISGKGNIGGQRYQFTGSANDLTTQPKRLANPATFLLAASGDKEIKIAATVDRRGSKKIDDIRFQMPDVNIPAQMLGSQNSLLVNVSPGKMNADISIRMVDNRITGKMTFRQKDVRLAVQHLHPNVGGQLVAANIDNELNQINGFWVEIDLHGTVDDMDVKMKSDLGLKVADVFGQVVNATLQQTVARQQQKLDSLVQSEVDILTARHQKEINQILSILNVEMKSVANLQKLLPKASSWPKIR
jgi:uncharacterized protein (TIGR03545 family)